MLASKQIAFGKAAGGRLPDGVIPVEYLESTGTQYIDTGITPATNSTVLFDYELGRNSSATGRRFILGDSNSSVSHYCEIDSTNFYKCMREIPVATSPDVMYKARFEVQGSAGSNIAIVINGTEYTSSTEYAASATFGTFVLFRLTASYVGNGVRLGAVNMYVNSERVRDLIPVLYYGVPCMYDKVSGEFFYNQGTGEFVAGPVKEDVEYSARDYIQDGLVAMWDGIENAGFGKSSPDNVCVDLSGNGHDGIFWGEMVKEENYFWSPRVDNTSLVRGALYSNLTTEERNAILSECTMQVAAHLCPQSLFKYESLYHRLMSVGGFLTCGLHPAGGVYYGMPLWKGNFDAGGFDSKITLTLSSVGTSARIISSNGSATEWEVSNIQDYTAFGITGLTDPPNIWNYGESGTKFYSYRLYSRALTAEEIAYNYSIDKARFGL